MNTTEFIEKLKEQLEIEDEFITEETRFDSLDAWDSMASLMIIAFVDQEFSKKVTADDIKKLTTVQSLIELIGLDKILS